MENKFLQYVSTLRLLLQIPVAGVLYKNWHDGFFATLIRSYWSQRYSIAWRFLSRGTLKRSPVTCNQRIKLAVKSTEEFNHWSVMCSKLNKVCRKRIIKGVYILQLWIVHMSGLSKHWSQFVLYVHSVIEHQR